MRYMIASGMLFALSACGGDAVETDLPNSSTTSATTSEGAGQDENIYTRQNVPGAIEGREALAVEIDQMVPSFTAETVIKLNAIVARSQALTAQYLPAQKALKAKIDTAAQENATSAAKAEAVSVIEKLSALHAESVIVKSDMDAAVAELKASDEPYNSELLQGMITYVNDVEQLFDQRIKQYSAQLGG